MRSSFAARKVKNPVVLIVLDGWGVSAPGEFNAIALAKTPNFEMIKSQFGSVDICASGICVGVTEGQMGNSEVGHLTLGAGRVIFQDLMRVNEEIESGKLAKNGMLLSILRKSKRSGSTVHFLGLVSDGGVHSHIRHLFALLKIAKDLGLEKIKVHVILDGRDTPPKSGSDYMASLQSFLDDLGVGEIATVSGRYYAMDRDNRWDRTKLAYDAIVYGMGERFQSGVESIVASYEKHVTDEFIIPNVIGNYEGIADDDVVFFFNFRPDRARQMTRALALPQKEFRGLFDRNETKRPKRVNLISMTTYDPDFKSVKSLLKREHVFSTLSNVLEKNQIRQLRIAETEKYAHVTYFFNGLSERPRRLEERVMIPSSKIGTYDKGPEMSSSEITDAAIEKIGSQKYGFVLINFANADMVGHSGNVEATIRAVEKVDECLGRIISEWRKMEDKLTILVTADHGNAEKMFDETTKQPHTAHTSNPVPLVVVSKNWKIASMPGYKMGLVDIAPTILKIMGIPKPKVMSGQPVVEQVN
ncbi:MAG: 2,3-bisphosphoglycerate-independent phosphoglycerate mutase [Nitrososphaerales archaeon]